MSRFITNTAHGIDAEYDNDFIASIKKIAKKIHIRGVCLCAKECKNE